MQLYHIALNNLRRRKAKMIFILLGLTIGIATVTAVYSVMEAMEAEMTRQASEFGANVVITADKGELAFSYGGITLPDVLFDVEQLTLDDVAAVGNINYRRMIRVVAPKLLGVVSANGREVIVAGVHPQEQFRAKPWLRLQEDASTAGGAPMIDDENGENIGKMKEMELDVYYLDLARQDPTKIVLGERQVVAGSAAAAALAVKPGDHLNLGGEEFVVFGLLKENGSLEDEQLIMNLADAQELLGRPQEVTVIELAIDYTLGKEAELLSALTEALPHAQISSVRQELLRRDDMLTRVARFGITISVLILLVGTLVVVLSVSGAVRERTREIGIFRALGFRQSHVAKIILLEALFTSLGGGALGYMSGLILARSIGPLLISGEIYIPWRLDLFVAALSLSVVIGLLAGILPARQAARLDPAEALRFI
jgi:putative ABC transport system permease protein